MCARSRWHDGKSRSIFSQEMTLDALKLCGTAASSLDHVYVRESGRIPVVVSEDAFGTLFRASSFQFRLHHARGWVEAGLGEAFVECET